MAVVKKKTRFKSIETAEKRVLLLERRLKELDDICSRYRQDARRERDKNLLLAKLAAKGPAFFNPIEAMAAEIARDHILAENGINPDGSPIPK